MNLQQGTVHVFTYKAGLLSRVAHDLRLSASDWSVQVVGETVSARFPVAGLSVDGAVVRDTVDPSTPGRSDKHQIARTIRDELLHAHVAPDLTWVGTVRPDGPLRRFDGALSLRGVSRPAAFTGRLDGDTLRAEAWLVPSRWGIAPYTALLGAIRLQDKVRVQVALAGWPG